MKNDYINIFIDKEYPKFIDKYLTTRTLKRLKDVTQFCGCDYTKLYHPLFLYTRFDHSLVVAHMTWHFTHDKKATLASLFHDVGTPCFAHSIDYVLGDYVRQESSEKKITDVLKLDKELLNYLKQDGCSLDDFERLDFYTILENKSPKLCTDRLDGVLHTCFIWLHTHSIDLIKEVYDDLVVLKNEEGRKEIGFTHQKQALSFVHMVFSYASELQSNRNKYTMKYVSEMVKLAIQKQFITLEDLYVKKEKEIVSILLKNFSSWKVFNEITDLKEEDVKPAFFSISFETKKRNVIPLVKVKDISQRICDFSKEAEEVYNRLEQMHFPLYAYHERIQNLE